MNSVLEIENRVERMGESKSMSDSHSDYQFDCKKSEFLKMNLEWSFTQNNKCV